MVVLLLAVLALVQVDAGYCASDKDQHALKSNGKHFIKNIVECYCVDNIIMECVPEMDDDCVMELGFTEECGECVTELNECMQKKCYKVCKGLLSNSIMCNYCVHSHKCDKAFQKCSGSPLKHGQVLK